MDVSRMELTAPAGSFAALAAAIRAGADSVYFGVGELNMRARGARNFEPAELRKVARICRWCGLRSYLALNTIVYDEEMSAVRGLCEAAKAAGVSAVIAGDIAVMQCARDLGLPVHVSVQANVSNLAAVRFYAQFADVIVLARELTLDQVSRICRAIREEGIRGPSGEQVRIELFVHGALCVGVSGLCHMSLATVNTSGNRGVCQQPCRRRYRVVDDETGAELALDNEFVMSPKDICLIQHLDRLVASGASVLKIEGRGRTADYVGTVTRVYREALTALNEDRYDPTATEEWLADLRSVFNRGFWMGGYYLGKRLDAWAETQNSQATTRREQLGVVTNYFAKAGIMEFKLWLERLDVGDELLVEGSTTGALHFALAGMYADDRPADTAAHGAVITTPTPARVRRNDKVFRVVARQA